LWPDPPTFLEPLKDQVFHLHASGKLECRVHGIPYPTVTFKKDWRIIAGSHRIKIVREEYDHWTLNIQNTIHMDEGLYECIAENLAGKVYCTSNVKITGLVLLTNYYLFCNSVKPSRRVSVKLKALDSFKIIFNVHGCRGLDPRGVNNSFFC